MDSKELYELHKGKKANYDGIIGTVCGYDEDNENSLIMAIDSLDDRYSNTGWKTSEFNANIDPSYVSVNIKYLWVRERNIID